MPFVAPKETRDLYLQVHGDDNAPVATSPPSSGNDVASTPPPTDQPPQADPASNNGNGPLLTLTPQATNWATGQSQPVVPQEPTVDAQMVQGAQPDIATSEDSGDAGATKGGYIAPESAREAYVKTYGDDSDKGSFVAGPEARNEYVNQLATGDEDPAHLYATGQEDDKDAVIQAIRQRDAGWDAMSPGQKGLVVAGNVVKGAGGLIKGGIEGIASAPQQVGNLAAFGRDLATIASNGKGPEEIQHKAQVDLEAGRITHKQFDAVSEITAKLTDLDQQLNSGKLSPDQYNAQRNALTGPDTGQTPEQQRATREVVATGAKTGTGLVNTGVSVLQAPANIPGIGGLFPQATAADQAELAKKGILIPQTGDTRKISDADLSQNLDILRARVQGQNEFLKGNVGAPGEAILGVLNRGHPVLTPEQLEQQGQPVDPSAIEGGETAAGIAQMLLPVPGVEGAANLLARVGLGATGATLKGLGAGSQFVSKLAFKRLGGWGVFHALTNPSGLETALKTAAGAGAAYLGGGLSKYAGDLLMDSRSLLAGDASKLAEHGIAGQLFGRTAANAAQGGATMGLYALPSAESPEDVGQAVGQGAVIGAGVGAPGVGLQSLRSRLFDSLYHGTRYDPKAAKTWIDYGSDKGMDAQSKQMASDLSDKQQQTLNDLKHYGRGYYEAYYVDNPTFEKVVAEGAGAKGASPDNVKAAGIAMAPGPNGELPKVFIRQGQLDNALFHETGHALWNWLPDDAKQSVIKAGLDKNDPNDFTRWYVDRTSEGKISNADYDSLPTQAQVDDGSAKPGPLGLTKDEVGEEIGAEQFNKLFQGQPPAQLTKNPTWQRSIQLGLGNVLEQMGVPTTTAEAQSKMGVQPSVASTLILDKFLREQMPPKSTVSPDAQPGPESGKAPLEIGPEARGQKAADYFASRGQRQASGPSIDPEVRATQNRQAVKSDLIKGGRMTPQEADQYVDVGPADSINQLYRDALMRKGKTDAAARDQAQAPPIVSQGTETPEAVPVEPKAEPTPSTPARSTAVEADAVAALQHLGIGPNEARDLVSKAQGGTAEEITTNALKSRGGPGKTTRPSLPEVAPGMPQPKEAEPSQIQAPQPKRSPQEEAIAALNPDEQKLFQESQTVVPERITPEMVAANKKYSDALGDAFERQGEQPQPAAGTGTPSKGVNAVTGKSTVFGLNYDGSVDREDNGRGAFGYNTRDPLLVGVALPINMVKRTLKDYVTDPKVFKDIQDGKYKVRVTTEDGRSIDAKIVDVGPAEWTGAAIDLTYGATKALGLNDNTNVSYQILGPDGNPMPISGVPDKVAEGMGQPYQHKTLVHTRQSSPDIAPTPERTARGEMVAPPASDLPKPPGFEMPGQSEPSKENASSAKAQTPDEQAFQDQKRAFEEDQARQRKQSEQDRSAVKSEAIEAARQAAQQLIHEQGKKFRSDDARESAVTEQQTQDLLGQHAGAVPDNRVQLRVDPDTGRQAITGDRLVTGDAVHDFLTANVPHAQIDFANKISTAIQNGTPIHATYDSAAIKGLQGVPTGESRAIEQKMSSADARAQGLGDVTEAGKTIIPTAVGVKVDPKNGNRIYAQGISPDKVVNNAVHLSEALGKASPYHDVTGTPFAQDLAKYIQNQKNGWKGDGSAALQGTTNINIVVNPDYRPQPLDKVKADFINASFHNPLARNETIKGQNARELAQANQGHLTESGETNPLREGIDNAKIRENATDLWSKKTLQPSTETIRADLTKALYDIPEHATPKIRPSSQAVAEVLQEHGLPKPRYVAAGFMPMLDKVRKEHGQTGVNRLLRARMTVGQLEKEYGVTVPGADKGQVVTGQDVASSKASFMPMTEGDEKSVRGTKRSSKVATVPTMPKPSETKSLIFESAKKLMGITHNPDEAGYVLPDGSMLDFSGRHEMEGEYHKASNGTWKTQPGNKDWMAGQRNTDHRDVQYEGRPEDRFEAMQRFIQEGAIRVDKASGLLNIGPKPITGIQRSFILKMIKEAKDRGDAINLDVEGEDGRPVFSKIAGVGDSIGRLISSILDAQDKINGRGSRFMPMTTEEYPRTPVMFLPMPWSMPSKQRDEREYIGYERGVTR
jgi:hypothetical protein